jgi:hypothetical protein
LKSDCFCELTLFVEFTISLSLVLSDNSLTYFSDTESNKKLSQKDKSTKTKENVNLKE